MINSNFDLTIAVPAYGRVAELGELLESLRQQTVMPRELLICEDMSPERTQIAAMCKQWGPMLAERGCSLKYVENSTNLGYDGNVRKLFEEASYPWVMLIGNDDAMLPECTAAVQSYLSRFPETLCASRSFLRFEKTPAEIIGVSKIIDHDTLMTIHNSSPKLVFRSCGFVGGLVINKDWARSKSTNIFDGTLYYQIYLACEAYCELGIGYISTPIVAGRSGNPPLFGSAAIEKSVHIPGSYTPQGRAKMWSSVLNISQYVGSRYSIDLMTDIRNELVMRQSFHVFEMLAGASKEINGEMKFELNKIGLFFGSVSYLLYFNNYLLGRWSKYFYVFVRKIAQ